MRRKYPRNLVVGLPLFLSSEATSKKKNYDSINGIYQSKHHLNVLIRIYKSFPELNEVKSGFD
jgi:hypothetical protein